MINPPSPTRLELYQRLIRHSHDVISTLDLTELLNRIVHAAADICLAEAAAIFILNESNNELRFETVTYKDRPDITSVVVPVENSIAGWMVTHHQHVILNNLQHDYQHNAQIDIRMYPGIQSLLGIPLTAKGKIVGALEVFNKTTSNFNDDDLELLNALGIQAAIAIENSRIFQQSDLIAEMVHELRTPMASLNTAVQILVRKDIDEKERLYLSNIIQAEISRLSELTSFFLDLARLESGRAQFHAQKVDLTQIIHDCVEMMRARAQERQLTIKNRLLPDFPSTHADPDMIKQVVINLLSNAIKYSFTGGTIVLESVVNGKYLGFSISDTGPGISNEDMKRLFERFYRVPGSEKLASGTGLGLSICKRIIEAHQGRIDVESQEGKGTKFTVLIPNIQQHP